MAGLATTQQAVPKAMGFSGGKGPRGDLDRLMKERADLLEAGCYT